MLVEDNGPIHTSRLSRAALAARAHWLTVEWLPKYAPELNGLEVAWRDLKAHHLAHQTFQTVDAFHQAIHATTIRWPSSESLLRCRPASVGACRRSRRRTCGTTA